MKSVIITGAGAGMGLATARCLRDAGYRVFALDIRPPLDENGIIPIEVSVTEQSSLDIAAKIVREYTDELYAIVHFAGVYMLDSLIEISEENFKRAYDINLFGAYRVNKTFHSMLKPGSRILITTSELAPLDPLPFTGLYALTKSALDKYAYSLRMELQLSDIFVSVLRPGAVNTGMLGVSTAALDKFTSETKLYSYNAGRFKSIVDSVEACSIPAEKVADLALKIVSKKRPAHIYKINRNPLLLLLNLLPARLQTAIIKRILK